MNELGITFILEKKCHTTFNNLTHGPDQLQMERCSIQNYQLEMFGVRHLVEYSSRYSHAKMNKYYIVFFIQLMTTN